MEETQNDILEITKNDMLVLLIASIITTIIYLVIIAIKTKNTNIIDYIKALASCFIFTVCIFFIIVEIKFLKQMIYQQSAYGGIIAVSLGWDTIIFVIVMECVERDFNLHFEFISAITNFIFFHIFQYFFLIGFELGAIITWYAAYVSRKNISQCIALILFGIIFAVSGYFFFNIINLKMGKKNQTKDENKKHKIISQVKVSGIIFVLVGIFIVFAYFDSFNIKNKKENEGVVINIIPAKKSDDKKQTYYPVISYTVNNKKYVKEIDSVSGKYSIGQTVKIIYNEQNPEEIDIKQSIILIIIGAIFISAGLFLILNKQKGIIQKKLEE